jgi:hypothetical protein
VTRSAPSAGGAGAAREGSERLHARVRAYASRALQAPGAPAPGGAEFDALALDIARFQAEHNPAFARLCRHHGARLDTLEAVPAVPADAFRLGRVAAHPELADVACFHTSGTTGGSGRHFFRSLETYRELSVSWGRRALSGPGRCPLPCTVLALAPPYEPERRSSLGFMMAELMRVLDGRALSGGAFDANEPGRWLLAAGAVDVAGLRRGVALAQRRGEGVLLLATSFALVWLLDVLAGQPLPLPEGSVVMLTGGFKGRTRAVDERDLGAALSSALAVPPERLIGEYGMTELSSQLYDSGLHRGSDAPSVFVEPPWLRVTPVDPLTFRPLPAGQVGLARFTDLANVDSALNVLTRDLVRRVPGGIVLCGRAPGARLRGCSLAVELLAAWADGPAPAGAGEAGPR